MKYQKFIIEDYRGIIKPIEININNHLFCIIGENECGKSTILHGICAFDYTNDSTAQGWHIKDASNAYTLYNISKITAIIDIKNTKEKIQQIITKHNPNNDKLIKFNSLTITRLLNGNSYYIIKELEQETKEIQNKIARDIIENLPCIIYFDDFLEPLPEQINLSDANNTWTKVFKLIIDNKHKGRIKFEELLDTNTKQNTIDALCADIALSLNNAITTEWKEMRLDKKDFNAEIQVRFNRTTYLLRFVLVEKTKNNEYRYFDLKQRSKGFCWFFNFVMRSEFHPKSKFGSKKGAIFLFDEPGAYLHISMQRKLCQKLKLLSEDNIVIYCTHAPDLIELDNIHKTFICYRNQQDNNNILLTMANDFYETKVLNEKQKQMILEPLLHKSIIHDIYNLEKQKKPSKIIDILKKNGNFVYQEGKDLVTTIAAKTINEASKN